MGPRIHLRVVDGVVVVGLTAQIAVRVHFVVSDRVAAVGGAVVDARQWAFAANQDFLADLFINAKDVNLPQKSVILLRGGLRRCCTVGSTLNCAVTAAMLTPLSCA